MKALLLTHGSRGDAQPFVALAQGLATRGWQVRLAAPARFAALAADHAVAFHPLDDGILELQDALAGRGTGAAITAARQARPLLRRMLDTTTALLSQDPPDVVVHHPKALAGPHLAEAFGVPAVAATLLPLFVATSEFPLPLLPPGIRLPGPVARQTWRLTALIDAPYRRMIGTWRREALGLPTRTAASVTTASDGHPAPVPLHAWSRHLLPAPADWPVAAAPLGFWFTPDSSQWTPPAELTAFLDAGAPPLYLGFGSMLDRDPVGLTRTVLDAIARAGVRAVLATGWGGLQPGTRSGDDVFVLDQAPHDWLLPRVVAVVHHGGAGTVAAAARAGRPQIIRPFLADQPFWADRIHRLGLGPAPLSGRLTPQRLAQAITTATSDPDLARQASTVGASIRAEDGIAAAAQRLDEITQRRSAE